LAVSHPESHTDTKMRGEPDAVAAWVDGHPDEGLLHEGLDDQLSPAESALVAEHVSGCASCRARVAEAHGLIGAARKILTRLAEAPAEEAPAPVIPAETPRPIEAAPEAPGADGPGPAALSPVTSLAPSVTSAVSPAIPVVAAAPVQPTPAAFPAPGSTSMRPAPPRPKPARPASSLNWKRTGQMAAVLVVVISGAMAWRTVGKDFGQAAVPTRFPSAPAPVSVAEVASAGPTADGGSGSEPAVDSVNSEVADGAVAFDSLVLTRRVCTVQCDDFELHVSNTGVLRYMQRVRYGQPRMVEASSADAALRRMSALVSSLLFETSAVPVSGRSVCVVFDSKHAPALQLMVARGASRSLHANSCAAAPKDLIELGEQIDSLAGREKLEQALQAAPKN
jgi:hypothetical protein